MKEKMNAKDIEETTLVAEEISKNKKIKKADKKVKKEKVKKVREDGFLKQTRQEMKRVSWPSLKDVFKYSIATFAFCIIVAGFFILLDLGLALVKGLF